MFSWLKTPEPKEATWSEISQAFIEYYKCITYSQIDREECPVIYTNVPSLPIIEEGFSADTKPITFLTCYFIQTHKGSFSIAQWCITNTRFFFSRYQNAQRKRRQTRN